MAIQKENQNFNHQTPLDYSGTYQNQWVILILMSHYFNSTWFLVYEVAVDLVVFPYWKALMGFLKEEK